MCTSTSWRRGPGRRLARSLEFWAALGALLGVVLINILPGVAIGVTLSFILLIHTIEHRLARAQWRRLALQ